MSARKYGEGKTPHRTFRVEDEEWDPFLENTRRAGTDATGALGAFIRWYNGRPGAELPQRPEPES